MTGGQAEHQFGTEIGSRRELNELQRLAKTHSIQKVRDWVDEEIPREMMGKPNEMRAFRENDEPAVRHETSRQTERSIQRITGTDGPDDYYSADENSFALTDCASSSATDDTDDDQIYHDAVFGDDYLEAAEHASEEPYAGHNQRDANLLRARLLNGENQTVCTIKSIQNFDKMDEYLSFVANIPRTNGSLDEITPAEDDPEITPAPVEDNSAVVAQLRPNNPGPQLSHNFQQNRSRTVMPAEDDSDLFTPPLAIDSGPRLPHRFLKRPALRETPPIGEISKQRGSHSTSPQVVDDVQENNEQRIGKLLAEGKATVSNLDELQEKLSHGEDASLFIPAVHLPETDRTPEQSRQAAEKYAAQLGLTVKTDKKSGQNVTRGPGIKSILKPKFAPEKRPEMSAKHKLDVAANKEAFAHDQASKSTGITKIFKNQVASWHHKQKKKYEKKSEKYKTREETAQAIDTAAKRNARAAREDAETIRAEAETTLDQGELREAAKAEQLAEQAQKAERERTPKSMGGKVDRAKQKVAELKEKLQEINNYPIEITQQDLSAYKFREAQGHHAPEFHFIPNIKKNKHKLHKQKENKYLDIYKNLVKKPEKNIDDTRKLNDTKYNIIHTRNKRRSLISDKLITARVDADHPYGPDQGSKVLRGVPTINNRERAFADTDLDGTAGGRKFHSLFKGRKNILLQQVRNRAIQLGLGVLLGAG